MDPWLQISHNWPSKNIILPIILFSITYNIPKFYELKVVTARDTIEHSSNDNQTVSTENYETHRDNSSYEEYYQENVSILPTNMRLNSWYIKIYLIYINMVTHGIIPMLTLTILNMAIYKQVRESSF